MRSPKEQYQYLLDLIADLGMSKAFEFRFSQLLRRRRVLVRIGGNNIYVRPRTTDLLVAKACFSGEFDLLAERFDPDFAGLIIDAGGYIGTSAICLSKLFPKSTIITIEPSTSNFEILTENIKNNSRIHAVKAALATTAGETVWLQDRQVGNWGFSVIDLPKEDKGAEKLEMVTTTSISEIRELFPEKEVGVLKLDIEGAEKHLFETARDQLRPIPVIFAELHDFFIDGCETAFRSLDPDRQVENFGGEKFLSLAVR